VCDTLVRLVGRGLVLHDDPRLDAAAECAVRSSYSDGTGWKLVPGREGGDVTALVAAALAVWALRQNLKPRQGTGRVVSSSRRAVVI
jgi:hypothetical protein